jgi:hypothetical protein
MKKTIIIMAGIFLSLLGLNGQSVSNLYKIVQQIHLGEFLVGWIYI